MALRTFVKFNSITNLTDARYGAGMYVDLLGFDLDPSSEKYSSPEFFKEISGWVSGVDFVAEFTYESQPTILEILAEYPTITWIEYDQIQELRSLVGKGFSLIYKINVKDLSQLDPQLLAELDQSEIHLHVVSSSDRLTKEEVETIGVVAKKCKVILGTGIHVDSVNNLLKTGLFGISLSGSAEIKPGLKDLDELADILEKIEEED